MRLTIDEDVFPPDMGLCAQNLAHISQRYEPERALDMGCGTAYLACARSNAARNSEVGSINIVQSELFEDLPSSVRFDLIVFNQPFGPGDGQRICGCGPDGGYDVCRRFMTEAPAHLSENGVLLTPFSDREASQHSPHNVASELGYRVATVFDQYYSESNNFIFEIRPR